ncbi:MAG: hypothetical protein Q9227_002393 [Pyrenula ochraceoflavens]
MYPTLPILRHAQVQKLAGEMDRSSEAYCLISSLCAFVLIQPGMGTSDDEAAIQSRQSTTMLLLEDILHVRKGCDYIDPPSTNAAVISFFLFGCYFSLDKHNMAWYFLREATTLVQIMGMHEETAYFTKDITEKFLKRNLFWLLFVTERAYALQRHRPLSLQATIELPMIEETDTAIAGFLYLIELFSPFDDTFIGLWNKSRNDCSSTWLAQMQERLFQALPHDLPTTDGQAADLRITQQWLRTMVWQLAITNGLLSSTSPDTSMTFTYPIVIARDLLLDTQRLTLESMEIHGIGLVISTTSKVHGSNTDHIVSKIEKIFDIACTLADVIQCVVPMDASTLELRPAEYLNQFLSLLASLRGGRNRFLPLLLAKVAETNPSMIMPIVPAPSHIKAEPVSSYVSPTTPLGIDPFTPSVITDSATNSPFDDPQVASGLPPIPEIQYSSFPR